ELRTVTEIPVPTRNAAGGLVGELDRQGRIARGWVGGEVGCGWGCRSAVGPFTHDPAPLTCIAGAVTDREHTAGGGDSGAQSNPVLIRGIGEYVGGAPLASSGQILSGEPPTYSPIPRIST